MTREEALKKAIKIIMYCKAQFAKSKEAEEEALDIIEALEQEPCKDAISRQEAVEAFQMFREYESNRSNKGWVNRIETVLNQLPPVTPQPKTGHWIKISPANIFECSECVQNVMTSNICAYKFCHGCGAKMIEPQNSER